MSPRAGLSFCGGTLEGRPHDPSARALVVFVVIYKRGSETEALASLLPPPLSVSGLYLQESS